MRAYLQQGNHIVVSVPSQPPQHALFSKDGIRVCEANEKTPYIDLTARQRETGNIPDEIDRLVESYSLNTSHYGGGAKTTRATGIYNLGTAHATVVRDQNANHRIEIRGRVAKHVIDLHDRIIAGVIAPTVPYENVQVKGGLPGVKEAFWQLVDAVRRSFRTWRLA